MKTEPSHLRIRSLAAFTMVEIAICLAVIGFALVAIIGVLPIGMSVQKDNREETVINFDANYLMNAIRTGALGQNELTNYVIVITNISTSYVSDGNGNYSSNGVYLSWYSNTFNGPFGVVSNTITLTANFLTNGYNIMGLLSTPKYVDAPGGNGNFYSNYVTADFRSITGSPIDQGQSQASRDFAFSYRVFPEIIPTGSPVSDNSFAVIYGNAFAKNLQNNFHDIRLRFRWPIIPGGRTGNGTQVYRTSASGAINLVNGLYFFQPQAYTNINTAAGYTNAIP